jgi:enoyl-CoA hydratase
LAFEVRLERRGQTATLTIDNPPVNALHPDVARALEAQLEQIGADEDIRAVVLTGAGSHFMGGGDIAYFRTLTRASAERYVLGIQRMQHAIGLLPQPVIAAVNGPAAGGGLALALAADLRLCSRTARVNAAFVRIGLSGCDMGVSYLLPRLVGPTLAFEMMLTGRLIDPQEALERGLVLRVVPDGSVVDAALEVARTICANTPLGVRMTKQTMWANLEAPSLPNAIELENRTQVLCLRTEGFQQAVAAFLQRRSAASRG